MSNDRCIFKEGSLAIPQGFVDRTVNILADAQSLQPPVNISRDNLPAGAQLSDYIAQQLGELQHNVTGWEEQTITEVVLGENYCTGVGLNYSFLHPDTRRIWQTQAVFDCGNGAILVISTSKAAEFTPEEQANFLQIIQSFRPHA